MPAQDPSLNFEDLLATVKESERGRWFISEFESRLRKADTGNILSAIHKLESVIAGQGQSGMDTLLVARARTAIASARREIAGLDHGQKQLSDEGRLFAKLADMARATFSSENPQASAVNAGVSRALLLVDQLDQDFGTPAAADAKASYFTPDNAVFEPVKAEPPKAIAPPVVTPSPAVKDVERGARLVIRKAGDADSASAAPVLNTVVDAVPPAPVLQIPTVTAEATAVPSIQSKTSRVVIIRRKPEELLDVPLVDETESGSAA